MKQLKNALLLFAISILLCGCPTDDAGYNNIAFVNKSGRKIGCQIISEKVSNIYQDTVFYCNKTSDYFIGNDSSFILESPIRTGWGEELGTSYYIQFLVLDGELFKQYYSSPCDSIRKHVPILDVYRLKLSDLVKMNWTIVYPSKKR